MKFYALLALFGATEAARMTQHHSYQPQQQQLLKIGNRVLNQHKAGKILARAKALELPPFDQAEKEIMKEIERDGSLTWDELHHGLSMWEADTGKTITEDEWKMVHMGFQMVDGDGDGHVTMPEVKCAMGDPKACADNGVIDFHEVTPEMAKDAEDLLKQGFADGELTFDELLMGIEAFEAKHGQVSNGMKTMIKELFRMVDVDNSGSVSLAEMEAFVKQYE